MNDENTKNFHLFFPSLIKDSFYFECDDGWYELIFDLSKKITMVTNKCYAVQIKNKFHGLRFYIDWELDNVGGVNEKLEVVEYVQDLIFKAENKSYRICEVCGTNKTPAEKYCPDCSKKIYKK